MTDNNIERLKDVGFQLLAEWKLLNNALNYHISSDQYHPNIDVKSGAALYAFVCEEKVLYVGKTSLSISKRFAGYINPKNGQSTNLRCNENINKILIERKSIEIWTLSGVSPLRWGEFELNIAAGLEDSLIIELQPPWNILKSRPQKRLTESEMLEREHFDLPETPEKAPEAAMNGEEFQIELGVYYYRTGTINIPIDNSRSIGGDGDSLLIHLGEDGQSAVETKINRRANKTKSPRLFGGTKTARWFQEHFAEGSTVQALIVNPNEIILKLPI